VKIAAVVHAHHLQILNETLRHLENIPGNFDLFLNFSFIHPSNQKYLTKLKSQLEEAVPGNCYFSTSNNRGQDFGGMFSSISIAREKNLSYDLICKIHTKRDDETHINAFGGVTRTRWRNDLLANLLGSPQRVEKIISIFETSPSIGVYSNKKYYCELFEPKNNEINYKYFVKKLDLKQGCCWPENPFFLAGSMFWLRGDIWEFLKKSSITVQDFELGAGVDGTRAHAFERVVNGIVYHLGLNGYYD